MSEPLDEILQTAGANLTAADVELLAMIAGLVLIVIGVLVVATHLLDYFSRAAAASASSRLLPTLAQDALDDDLQEIYARTLRLDALIADHAAELSSPTGSRLGRAVRRYLVGEQARRFKAIQSGQQEKDEPPKPKEARLGRVEAALDEAIGAVEAQPTRAEPLADLLERLASEVDSAQQGSNQLRSKTAR
ncbi:MAG: hypothetical protein ACLFVJ_21615 [Persicimonas sp.]